VDRPIVHALRGLAYEACSPECLVGAFSEVRPTRILERSSFVLSIFSASLATLHANADRGGGNSASDLGMGRGLQRLRAHLGAGVHNPGSQARSGRKLAAGRRVGRGGPFGALGAYDPNTPTASTTPVPAPRRVPHVQTLRIRPFSRPILGGEPREGTSNSRLPRGLCGGGYFGGLPPLYAPNLLQGAFSEGRIQDTA
jgi:hypothetical protein